MELCCTNNLRAMLEEAGQLLGQAKGGLPSPTPRLPQWLASCPSGRGGRCLSRHSSTATGARGRQTLRWGAAHTHTLSWLAAEARPARHHLLPAQETLSLKQEAWAALGLPAGQERVCLSYAQPFHPPSRGTQGH